MITDFQQHHIKLDITAEHIWTEEMHYRIIHGEQVTDRQVKTGLVQRW